MMIKGNAEQRACVRGLVAHADQYARVRGSLRSAGDATQYAQARQAR